MNTILMACRKRSTVLCRERGGLSSGGSSFRFVVQKCARVFVPVSEGVCSHGGRSSTCWTMSMIGGILWRNTSEQLNRTAVWQGGQ